MRTSATPTSSDAVATIDTVPDTVAPLDGALTATVGGVVSDGVAGVVNVKSPLAAALPDASALRTRKWYSVEGCMPVTSTPWLKVRAPLEKTRKYEPVPSPTSTAESAGSSVVHEITADVLVI